MEENFLGEGNQSLFSSSYFSVSFVLRAIYYIEDKMMFVWARNGRMALRNNAKYTRLMIHFHTYISVRHCAFVPNSKHIL